jgi:hypothetical protein
MSPDYFASSATDLEIESAVRIVDEPSSVRRVLPILLKSTDIPAPLNRIQHLDLRDLPVGEARARILRGLGLRNNSSPDRDLTPSITKVYDTGIVRKLLDEALDADDLNAFVYDYFRPLREGLNASETKKGKIQFLIESLERTGELDRLLDLMARDYPAIYRRYVDLLQRQPS